MKIKVAVIDDSEIDYFIVNKLIEKQFADFETMFFKDVPSFLSNENMFHIALLDINLFAENYSLIEKKHIENIQIIKELKTNIYIITVSSTINVQDVADVLAAGSSYFIAKGYKQEEHLHIYLKKLKAVIEFENKLRSSINK